MREQDLFSQIDNQGKEMVAVNHTQSSEVTITSLEIAELTGKEHKNILRDIEVQLGHIYGDGGQLKFEHTYQHPQNRQFYKMYRLPKKEALLVISGYDAKIRMAIIDRLEYLENEFKKLNAPKLPQIPKSYGEALLEAGRLALEKEKLEAQIQADKPLVDFAKDVSQSSNAISVGEFAKLLSTQGIKLGQNKLFAWLRKSGYLMHDNEPYQKFIDCGYFATIEQVYQTFNSKQVSLKTLITGKGQIYFHKKLSALFNLKTKIAKA